MIRSHDEGPPPSSAVTLALGAVGAHVGIRYLANAADTRHLQLAFHHQLQDEEWSSSNARWITPGFRDPVGTVRTIAALVAARHRDGAVAYAFDPANATIDPQTGEVQLRDSRGLTCATFVLRLFQSAGLPLVREETWAHREEARVAEDDAAQSKLIEYLRLRDPTHAAAVEREIGCTRIRAEEVAAASGRDAPPAAFDEIVDFAAGLLVALQAS